MWNICRTCMTKGVEMISIFDQGKTPSISAMLMTISSLEFLQNDKLPSEICITCFETLEMTYYFKEQVTKCNNVLQKQVQRKSLLARCKMLAQQQASNERAEQSQVEELVSKEHLEYVPIVDVDDVATENVADCPSKCDPLVMDTYDPSSKCDTVSSNVELPLTNVACDDLPEASSSHYVNDVSSHFEGMDNKTETIELEEHGVQFGDNYEITPGEITSSNVADDDEFCSDDDLPITSVPESTGSYNTSQNVQQDSNENGVGTSKGSEGLNTMRDVGNPSIDKSSKCTHCNKRHKCDFCEKAFSTPGHLKEHLRKHTGERPFKCQYCNATYKRSNMLKIHTRLHTGESTPKQHVCEVCGKKFRTPFEVRTHMRKHTRENPLHTGETTTKPYKCDVCESSFDAPSYLKRHMIKHTGERPFKCEYCIAKFKSKSGLKYHTRLHTGEAKPYQCDVCEYSFEAPSRLMRHMRTHTGEAPLKPHKCGVCGKSFELPGSLRSHMKLHMN